MAIWDLIAAPILKIIDKVIPDPQAKMQAEIQLMQLQNSAEMAELDANLRLALGQQDINKVEAGQGNFKGGWRPAIGWIGAFSLAYQFIVQPLLEWFSASHGWTPPPKLDLGDLITIVGGMLGLGTLHAAENIKGVK